MRLRDPATTSIRVPFLDLEFDSRIVLVSGGPVIALLALASLGAIRAWTVALARIQDSMPTIDGESLDEYPNVIDLAAYSMPETPEIWRHLLTVFAYPLFLAGALLESAWLTYSVVFGSTRITWPLWLVLFITAAIWLRAVFFLGRMWLNRILKLSLAVRDVLRQKRSS